eukprot:COSAG03_NODE_21503_length_303_cov_0.892157_1_plen_47_part_00
MVPCCNDLEIIYIPQSHMNSAVVVVVAESATGDSLRETDSLREADS